MEKNHEKPRIVFLGQKIFGEAAWKYLSGQIDGDLEVVAVVTNFDSAPVWWQSNEIFEQSGHLPQIDNSARNNDQILEAIVKYRANWLISIQHPWIIPSEILSAVGGRAINIHNAKLPEYQGYNAVNHSILNGDRTFYVSAHWMVPEVDAGKLVYEASFSIDQDDTAVSLNAKNHHAGLELVKTITGLIKSRQPLPSRPIEGTPRFYKRSSIDGLREISSPQDSLEVSLKTRAFFFPPFEPAYVRVNGRKHYVLPQGIYDHGYNFMPDPHFARRLVDSIEIPRINIE